MATPIPLRADFDGPGLHCLARETKDANQVRRLLALAGIHEGGSRTDAVRISSMTLQIVRLGPAVQRPRFAASLYRDIDRLAAAIETP